MRAILCGANGAMGKLIDEILGSEVVGRVSIDGENGVCKTFEELGNVGGDMVIDFSHHTAVADVMAYALSRKLPVVIGTTGHTPEEKEIIYKAAQEIPVFYSGNVSVGIAVLCRMARQAASFFPDADIEIVEIHHNRKVDAPSGTAHMLFNAIRQVRPDAVEACGRAGEGKRRKNEIGVASLRMGNVVGIHEVHICTPSQTLTLRHEAGNRGMLAEGAVNAARFMVGKAQGLYTMEELLEEKK